MSIRDHWLSTFLILVLAAPVAAICGNGLVNPGEQCDLGLANCEPAVCCETSCDSNCQLIGRCTGSQSCCSSDDDCPAGDGCCGNGALEGPEECDDGNRIGGDCCSPSCQIETAPCVPMPPECAVVGPLNVIGNPSIRRLTLRDSRPIDGQFDLFARDRFVLPDGLDIDPDSETVVLVLTENNGGNGVRELYRGVLDPANCGGVPCFTARTSSRGIDKKWEYRRGSTAASGAPGLDLARLTRNLGFPSQINEAYTLRAAPIAPPQLLGGRRRVRFSVVIGDLCVTRLLDCARNHRGTRFLCREVHCADGQLQRGEQCGEAGLSCRTGKECDSCRCVIPLPQ